jgi:hypothetical protein
VELPAHNRGHHAKSNSQKPAKGFAFDFEGHLWGTAVRIFWLMDIS